MMVTTLRQIEATPVNYPDAPSGLSAAAAALNAAMIWQRIEAYTAHRWTPRGASWVVEGPGEWFPPLTPAIVSTVEVWSGAAEWEAATLDAAPLGGFWLPATGPYRFSATIGDDYADVPEAVLEAFRRLAEYMAANAAARGGIRSDALGDARRAYWMNAVAHAMDASGAGDLLRRYRMA